MFRSLLLFCLLLTASLSHGQVKIQVDADQVGVGDSFIVTVSAQDLAPVYGMDLALAYTPELLEPLDNNESRAGIQATPASWWGDQSFVAANRFDEQEGLHTLVLARLAPAKPISGDGILWQGRFTALGEGMATVSIQRLEFGTSEGEKVLPELETSRVSIPVGAQETASGSPDGSRDRVASPVPWMAIALAGAGLVILVLLVVIWRLARQS